MTTRLLLAAARLAAIAGLIIGVATALTANAKPKTPIPLKEAKLNIEHNATDHDTGFQGFIDSDGWWLDDYALFRALHEEDPRSWLEWSADLRDREPGALAAARHRLSDRILHYQYLQWLVDEQWQRVRRACAGEASPTHSG